jgi:mersacidin/lichenicidin family type 2 lantibiotic
MSKVNVIRAWKDEEYRLSLTDAERAQLPEHPVGLIMLSEGEMDRVDGGCSDCCCWFFSLFDTL